MKREFEEFDGYMSRLRSVSSEEYEGFVFHNGKQHVACNCGLEPFISKEDKPFFEDNGKNWKKFWEVCKKHFPLHSICGSRCDMDNIMNKEELDYYRVRHYIYETTGLHGIDSYKNILEIGFGYGGAGLKFINDGHRYSGIDLVASDKALLLMKTRGGRQIFHEIEKSGIPEHLARKKYYDIIFSFNVFQHLTKQQRLDYYEQVSECIKPKKGLFIFEMFEWNYEECGDAIRDDFNTKFFGVKTHVDTREEFDDMLRESGLKEVHRERFPTTAHDTNVVIHVCKKV